MPPDARYQRCMVHFTRNVPSKVSHKHAAWAASALKAVFAMESRQAALEKAEQVATEMESKGLKAAASCLREGISETTTYLLDDYPVEHRRRIRIRTNNMIERPDREIRRRTRVVGSFPDGRSALMLVCAQRSATPPPTNGARAATWTCPVPARRHHAINRLKLSSRQRAEPLLRKTSGTTMPGPRQRRLPQNSSRCATPASPTSATTSTGRVPPADDSYYRKMDEYKTVRLLIIDNFMTTPIETRNAIDLFEIMEAREHRRATLIASQLEPNEWYLRIEGELMADSILNRIATGARYIDLDGPNMREYLAKEKET